MPLKHEKDLLARPEGAPLWARSTKFHWTMCVISHDVRRCLTLSQILDSYTGTSKASPASARTHWPFTVVCIPA